jgi:hypothetical protein
LGITKNKNKMEKPITTIKGIDIFEVVEYGKTCFMLKKGWCTVGYYYTLKEAKEQAKK